MRMIVTNVEIMGRVEHGGFIRDTYARVTASDGFDNEVRWKLQIKDAPVVGATVEVDIQLEDAETRRLAEQEALRALRRLVELKDGPRDKHYESMKGYAWNQARDAVGKVT